LPPGASARAKVIWGRISQHEGPAQREDVGGHKLHIFTTNIPRFHSRYRR
jgi:hypothetical protein